MTVLVSSIHRDSVLRSQVKRGLQSIERRHADLIDTGARQAIADSLDLDAALASDHPDEPRWDYLLGHRSTRKVLAMETHSAHDDQVTAVIAKRRHAIRQLEPHLLRGIRVDAWYWIASGNVSFSG